MYIFYTIFWLKIIIIKPVIFKDFYYFINNK